MERVKNKFILSVEEKPLVPDYVYKLCGISFYTLREVKISSEVNPSISRLRKTTVRDI